MNIKEIAEAVEGRLLTGNEDIEVLNISLNSAKMKSEDLFVPVIGERVDAHKFIVSAFENGAVASFTSEHKTQDELLMDLDIREILTREPGKRAMIYVDDTVAALQRLGRYYRKKYVSIPLVGVTGSVGKTTTREMIACALGAGKKTYATRGNANSQVGLPVTITEITEDAEVGVIELGMSEPGEMTRISNVACVDCAVITNIGLSHINQLKTQENILIEKLHILDGMPDGALLLLNGNDPILKNVDMELIHGYGIATDRNFKIEFYGTEENSIIRAEEISIVEGYPQFVVSLYDENENIRQQTPVRLSVMGRHMILNTLAALAICDHMNVSILDAAIKLQEFEGVSGRGETYRTNGVTIIDDSYNAAPQSMKAGLSVLNDLPGIGRRIAVLADMLELGENEAGYHRSVGEYIAAHAKNIDMLLLYGPLSLNIANGLGIKISRIKVVYFSEKEKLREYLIKNVQSGDVLFFKGSNSMGLSDIVKELYPKE
ncbi:MAG: UDP-N-acetylmuramoyl-tripeptide--D-alanyl-D-alanine ligase [Eubacteriales bacterium]|nr:UDP-N-acetylmuramoyl-tripeptide--D-alanyl-D-alanine ligase [Eubacteriales bacterium]